MKLWTIQNAEACKKALKTGCLRAPEDRNLMFISDEQFVPAYDWMADQMKKAIGMPPEGVQYPVWCWYAQEGKHERPDMRKNRGYGRKGSFIFLLTLEIPDDNVFLTDFDGWHFVLNDSFFIGEHEELSAEGYDHLYNQASDYFFSHPEEVEKTWENIICTHEDVTEENLQNRSIQATVWEIRTEWIKKAELFRAR